MARLSPTEYGISRTTTTKFAPLRLPCETRVLGDRYRVRRRIGRGGMADVYAADDLLLERVVALKILHEGIAEDPSGLERFRREALTLAAITSPHVVGIHDIGLEGSCVYLVMQHIDGHTLEQEITLSGEMAPVRAGIVLTQVLAGLAVMHHKGLIHRDVKPSNVLLDMDDHVVLLDLGIALDPRRSALTLPGMVAGTPGYMPPEACSEPTSDIYQVGLLMLFLLTGVDFARRPQGTTIEDLLRQLPTELANVARRATASMPSERFSSAEKMKDAVQLALQSTLGISSTRNDRAPTARLEDTDSTEPRPCADGSSDTNRADEPVALIVSPCPVVDSVYVDVYPELRSRSRLECISITPVEPSNESRLRYFKSPWIGVFLLAIALTVMAGTGA